MLTSATQEPQLEPRYRRVLSFGDLLDESIGLFRRHWAMFAMVSAVWLIPPGLLTVLVTASGAFSTTALVGQIETGVEPDLSAIGRFIVLFALIYVVSALFFLAWTTAVVVTTDEYAHAIEPKLTRVLGRTLRRYLPALISGLVYALAMIVLVMVATAIVVLFVIAFPVSVIAILAAIAGGLFWAFQPRARSTWLKWLIIVTAPFGLPIYFAGTWSMYLCAVVLERRGPIDSLRRSMQLVDRHWFRVVAILFVAGMIVSILQSAPSLLVQLPIRISAALRGQLEPSGPELAAGTAVGVAAQVLFASMAPIVYAMLFVDLRNRREGTDLAERLSRLESESAVGSSAPADG
ncbi:MAG: hypothetical protein JOZ87_40460 [Chloroflexi bacterium]|nr:hypothetical protein [Chloroflexota bacterium]